MWTENCLHVVKLMDIICYRYVVVIVARWLCAVVGIRIMYLE